MVFRYGIKNSRMVQVEWVPTSTLSCILLAASAEILAMAPVQVHTNTSNAYRATRGVRQVPMAKAHAARLDNGSLAD